MLKWTKTPPTEPGWYWIYPEMHGPYESGPQTVYVTLGRPGSAIADTLCVEGVLNAGIALGSPKWAGPIEEPAP